MKYLRELWKAFVDGWVLEDQQRKSRKDEAKRDIEKTLVELEEFCPVGEPFYYLGIRMVCIAHQFTVPELECSLIGIQGEYLNEITGNIEIFYAGYTKLNALKKENDYWKGYYFDTKLVEGKNEKD